MSASGRRDTRRILITPETAESLEPARFDAMTAVRREVTKTDFADAVVRVGLKHTQEVVKLIKEEGETDS